MPVAKPVAKPVRQHGQSPVVAPAIYLQVTDAQGRKGNVIGWDPVHEVYSVRWEDGTDSKTRRDRVTTRQITLPRPSDPLSSFFRTPLQVLNHVLSGRRAWSEGIEISPDQIMAMSPDGLRALVERRKVSWTKTGEVGDASLSDEH